MPLIDLSDKYTQIREHIGGLQFADIRLTDSFKNSYKNLIQNDQASGLIDIHWADFSAKLVTRTNKNIYVSNFWFYVGSALSEYYEALGQHKQVFLDIYGQEANADLARALKNGEAPPREHQRRIRAHFEDNEDLGEEDLEHFLRFITDYDSWGGAKTIDRADFYVSPLMEAANVLANSQSAIAEIAKQLAVSPQIRELIKSDQLTTLQVHFDNHQWLTLLEGTQIRVFVKDVMSYLFQENRYNSFLEQNGRLESTDYDSYLNLGRVNDEHQVYRVFRKTGVRLNQEDLEAGGQLRWFEDPFWDGSSYCYLTNQWAEARRGGPGGRRDRSLESFAYIFNSHYADLKIEIVERGNYRLLEKVQAPVDFSDLLHVPKPFLLLAGISGTGKTRFIRKQAEASGQLSENYCLTSVRPDWHEPSDLLGYISRLSVDGQSEYVTTDPLQFMAKAWREIIDKGLTVGLRELDQRGLCLVVSGNLELLNTVKPFWLCLDEMNLAPVEQYFSDYLSVLETREWKWEDTSFQYTTDALLKPATINQVHQSRKLREDLGFGPEIYNFFWDAICQFGMPLPFNLIVAGTVNVDETTHGFSRKVIDRALTFDFGEFFPNHFRSYLNPETDFKKLTFPILSDSRDYPHSINEQYRTDTIQFLESVNHILKTTPFELAYRALNEILIAVISTEPQDKLALKAVWDDFMMCKVLPRIEGDIDKLTAASGINILEELENLLADQLEPIWAADLDNNPSNQRPDLFRQRHGADMDVDEPLRIPCRTRQKLSWMKQRLRSAKFTSFWP